MLALTALCGLLGFALLSRCLLSGFSLSSRCCLALRLRCLFRFAPCALLGFAGNALLAFFLFTRSSLLTKALKLSLFGFILGIWADGWEKLTIVPTLVIMPLTFLGGTFYSISMLPPAWQTVSLFNPVVYLISGFRWSLFGEGDVGVGLSLAMVMLFLALCLGTIMWIFKTGYRIRE